MTIAEIARELRDIAVVYGFRPKEMPLAVVERLRDLAGALEAAAPPSGEPVGSIEMSDPEFLCLVADKIGSDTYSPELRAIAKRLAAAPPPAPLRAALADADARRRREVAERLPDGPWHDDSYRLRGQHESPCTAPGCTLESYHDDDHSDDPRNGPALMEWKHCAAGHEGAWIGEAVAILGPEGLRDALAGSGPDPVREAYEEAARVVDYQRGKAEEFNGDDDFNDARNYESALKNAAEELRRRAALAGREPEGRPAPPTPTPGSEE